MPLCQTDSAFWAWAPTSSGVADPSPTQRLAQAATALEEARRLLAEVGTQLGHVDGVSPPPPDPTLPTYPSGNTVPPPTIYRLLY